MSLLFSPCSDRPTSVQRIPQFDRAFLACWLTQRRQCCERREPAMQPSGSTTRRLRAISIVAMLLGLILVGNAAAAAPQDHVLRVQQAYFPQPLDPQQSSGTYLSTVLGANYEGLTRLDDALNIVPAAAETWEVDDTLTTWTFTLRPNLTYSDGSPLTAERFADAVRRTCDPNVGAEYQAILFDVAGCQAFATLYSSSEDGTPSPSDD